jgi:5'-AMP-activated protein kinase regulatory beta subunit
MERKTDLADALLDQHELQFAADVQGPVTDVNQEDWCKSCNVPSFVPYCSAGADTPPGEYCQTIPEIDVSKPPPSLPPHLLQVTLNNDAPNRDPTQLPEPNHVMLNHLYALAVKVSTPFMCAPYAQDGVVVLGATHRYRQKYVTTVLYKPLEA